MWLCFLVVVLLSGSVDAGLVLLQPNITGTHDTANDEASHSAPLVKSIIRSLQPGSACPPGHFFARRSCGQADCNLCFRPGFTEAFDFGGGGRGDCAACYPCTPGTYADTSRTFTSASTLSCTPCPAGTFSGEKGFIFFQQLGLQYDFRNFDVLDL
jgi:hypothetical protein